MAVSIKEALKIIENLTPTKAIQTKCIEEALGFVSATTIKSTIALPRFDNSAMDGFAIKLKDAGKEVRVVATILAGDNKSYTLKEGEAIKIMTGAKIPQGSEAVVPIEDVILKEDKIILPSNIRPNANIRFAGEDIDKGQIILEKGDFIKAYKIALLASQGVSYIDVFEKPRVAIFATGSELKMHYESLQTGQIYNSNTPALFARAKELGCEVRFVRQQQDSKEAIKDAIRKNLDVDLIITSGGVSVGDADFTKEAFLEEGMEILFSKIDIKPGKPTTLGRIDNTFILNLPGNPLAAMLNFELFGRFLINRIFKRNDPYIAPIIVKLGEDFKNKPGRDTLISGYFDGEFFWASKKRSPGMVSPLASANGFIILSKDVSQLQKGKELFFIPFYNFTAKEPKPLISS